MPCRKLRPRWSGPVTIVLRKRHYTFQLDLGNWVTRTPDAADNKAFFTPFGHEGADCSRIEAGPANPGYPEVLPKQVFSDALRFVFVLGTEGAGHHFTGPMFAKCKVPTCRCGLKGLLRLPYNTSHREGFLGPHSTPESVKGDVQRFVELVRQQRFQTPHASEINSHRVIFLNSRKGCAGTSGQISCWCFCCRCCRVCLLFALLGAAAMF